MNSYVAESESSAPAKPAWRAVWSLGLGVFGLITAEFLPASLLTPMASSLGVTEGVAGQTVTATALVALVTGLLITSATKSIDRRWVLMFFTFLQIISSLLVAFAPSLQVLLMGRLLLGVAIGGFWAMSTATAMRLVPARDVPKALSIIFAGVSIATVVAAPLGSFLGSLIGWRNVFILCVVPGVLALLWQLWVLPSMRPENGGSLRTLLHVLRRPGMIGGLLATIFIFSGHFAFFTYLRPFLETVGRASVETISLILLGFGLANFVGTSIAGHLLARNLRLTLALVPFGMGVLALLMVAFGHLALLDGLLVTLWGFAFGLVPVGWSTWLATTVPDEAESAGGLMVASIQLAISAGAAGGGLVFDLNGASGVFTVSGVLLVAAMVMVFAGVRVKPAAAE
ncbi:MFS transporter [Kluyvera ascorbata]|uniref:MFS transporter n=1 Tax=Kluyvera ascorbata TaxID=51288 RepID=UPI0018A5231C|nr:MFS transporter [Kluyvera ascorbata]BBV66365.1 MFS transporter [Klebsiella sp. STW0522-44]MDU3911775.1 MFS transporter [Kluyvera ascorbata]MDZ4032623.1 MFS transporter [Kluyvera ascorbata]UPQ69867.1 MFS transporter [Kluyvera ascorbata]HCL5621169.1 MFS transporter [Kluyvera ascorbata]